jgi:hypothetical protein
MNEAQSRGNAHGQRPSQVLRPVGALQLVKCSLYALPTDEFILNAQHGQR